MAKKPLPAGNPSKEDPQWTQWFSELPTAIIESGIHNPTVSNTSNVASYGMYTCIYTRIDDIVTMSGRITIDPTTVSTSTYVNMSLPIASEFTNVYDCCGAGASPTIASESVAIRANTTNNTAELIYVCPSAASSDIYFTFSYRILR